MSETQINKSLKDKQIAEAQVLLGNVAESQKNTIREKISEVFVSVGIPSRRSKVMLFCVLVIGLSSMLGLFFLTPPSDFPQDKIIVIKNGASLVQVSRILSEEHIIRSRIFFEFCVMTGFGDNGVRAGKYVFKTPIGACAVATRLVQGISGIPATRVTIPEGTSNNGVATILGEKLSQFDKASFLEHAQPLEGYLFPDTYFFLDGTSTQEVEAVMKSNFDKKIEALKSNIDSSGHTLSDIVIMASILEREATTDTDRELVSGVLWRRIKMGMPLQVDAPFLYLLGKKSSELTVTDLQMKSGYNTYRNKGLPDGPIGNPGLSALHSAISPKESQYLYYLSDDNGVMHYARTFEEHKANKAKYLR